MSKDINLLSSNTSHPTCQTLRESAGKNGPKKDQKLWSVPNGALAKLLRHWLYLRVFLYHWIIQLSAIKTTAHLSRQLFLPRHDGVLCIDLWDWRILKSFLEHIHKVTKCGWSEEWEYNLDRFKLEKCVRFQHYHSVRGLVLSQMHLLHSWANNLRDEEWSSRDMTHQ